MFIYKKKLVAIAALSMLITQSGVSALLPTVENIVIPTANACGNHGDKQCSDGIDNDGDGYSDYKPGGPTKTKDVTVNTKHSWYVGEMSVSFDDIVTVSDISGQFTYWKNQQHWYQCDAGDDGSYTLHHPGTANVHGVFFNKYGIKISEHYIKDLQQGIETPYGAVKIKFFFPDTIHYDNSGSCDFTVEVDKADNGDPDCTDEHDDDESGFAGNNECSDGVDNDNDGAVDYPEDFSCDGPDDDDESNPESECQDGIDNDNDGLEDEDDPGCSNAQDDNEGDGTAEYQDGIDNDGDGATDYPDDISCTSPTDNDESVPRAECEDGIDNDNDGFVDWDGVNCSASCTQGRIYDTNAGDPKARNLSETKIVDITCDGKINAYFTDDNAFVRVIKPSGSKQMLIACDNEAIDHCAGTSCCASWIPQWGAMVCSRDNTELAQIFSHYGQGGVKGCPGNDIKNHKIQVYAGDKIEVYYASFAAGNGWVNFTPTSTCTNGDPDPGCDGPNDDDEEEYVCSDGIDNDGDGLTDFPDDPGCDDEEDTTETDRYGPECDNGEDDDNDGQTDYPEDTNCTDPTDDDEDEAECEDGIDNDNDGATDFPDDFGCDSPTDDDEGNPLAACHDGNDNDNDGLTDMNDPGCSSPQDNDESDATTQCQDGIDNDNDGATDFPDDFGCDSPTDDDESDPLAQCQDGIDNDNDGLTDMNDPGCSSPQDNDESDGTSECQDGDDNDGDGFVDFPDDPSCTSEQDDDESPFDAVSDLRIGLNGPTSVFRTQQITYEAVATNDGPSKADNVTVSFPIPNGMFFDSGASHGSCVQNGVNVLCNSFSLLKNESKTINIVFTVTNQTQCSSTASAQTSVATSSTDPNPSNNTSNTVQTQIECSECQDGIDNDNDGATDFPDDFSCSSIIDDDESDPLAACQDGNDNDNDGLTDMNDPGCSSPQDNDESDGTSQCQDNIDNDNDGLTDMNDPGCSNPQDDDESDGTSECQDGIDNDQDGASDYPNDFGCSTPQDDDESDPLAACQDGNDNDNDGLTDMNDPGCSSPQDNDESDGTSECQDGIDNDGDIVIDMNDPGCSSPQDDDESDATTECQDNIDNDNDGASDYPNDFGCDSLIDNDESDPLAACQDGNDNDNDGLTDMNDPGCSSPQDNDESDGTSQCQDGIDNDQDGLTDMNDPGCSSPQDDDESDGTSECQDGIDNDNDGASDYPNDFGCDSPQDNDESDPLAQCQDGNDNDNDGLTDMNDPGCSSPQDNDESDGTSECQDGIDNDGDIVIDMNDPGCSSPQDDDESDATTECQDNIDNDNDGASDYPNDFGCDSLIDNDESDPLAACQDGNDNDNDGLTDMNDPGCSSPQDNDESDGTSECQDGIDNDQDGATDYPNDFSCDSPQDDDETGPKSGCQDGIDNDNDGFIDMNDPGCTDPQDNDETNVFKCSDGIDNDNDGATDFPDDFSCSSLYDDDETNPKSECQDGIDNDGDNVIDSNDPGCSSNQDNFEGDATTECQDGIDNDQDGATDYPNDFSCSSPIDDDETGPKSGCQDGIDNDNDGLTDMNDPGCTDPQDDDESDATSQCQDGIDNDNDGATDYPYDFSCDSPQDDNENDPLSGCQDGIDNDNDGLTDMNDPGCTDPQDNDEYNLVQHDLFITKSGPVSVQQGNTVLYTLTATNLGPQTATNVHIIDEIPTGLTLDAVNSSPNCVVIGSNVICNNFSLQDNESRTVNIAFQVGVGAACGSSIKNVGIVNTSATDPNPSNNRMEVFTDVTCQQTYQCSDGIDNDGDGVIDYPSDPDCTSPTDDDESPSVQPSLSIQKTDGRTTAAPGDVLTYTITIQNNSSVDAYGVDVSDNLPPEVEFISATYSPVLSTLSSGNMILLWSGINVPAHQSTILTVTARVRNNVQNGAHIVNAARVNNGINTYDSTTVEIAPQTGCVEVYVNALNSQNNPVSPTPAFGFKLENGDSLTNDSGGYARFGNVSVGSHTVSYIPTLGWQQNNVSPTNGIVFVQSNSACAQATFTIKEDFGVQQPSFSVSKTDNAGTIQPGQTLTYSIEVTNTSSVPATSVRIVDQLPAELTFISAANNGTYINGEVLWENITLQPNQSITLQVTTQVKPNVSPGTVILNIAQVIGNPNFVLVMAGVGSNFAADAAPMRYEAPVLVSAQDTTTVRTPDILVEDEPRPSSDSTITLRDSVDPVELGESFTYTIAITNMSDSAINGETVDQEIDPNLLVSSVSDSGRAGKGTIKWENISIPANTTRTLSATVSVEPTAQQNSTLLSSVTMNELSDTESTVINNSNTSSCQTEDVTITSVSDTSDPVAPGQEVQYFITLENSCSETTTQMVTAWLDGKSTFVSASDNGSSEGSIVKWNNLNIQPGTTQLRVTAKVSESVTSGQLQFSAKILGSERSETTRIEQSGNIANEVKLQVQQSANTQEAQPGNSIKYIVTVTNPSNDAANNVIVENRISAGTVSITDTNGGTNIGNGIKWTIPTLQPLESKSFSYTVRIDNSMRHGQTVRNTVTAISDNSGVHAVDTEEVRILTVLPQTGITSYKSLSATLSPSMKNQKVTAASIAGTTVFILWTSLISIGMTAGGVVGRRFWL